MVDKDRIKGAAEQAKGKAKEWTGKATGDKKTEVEGKVDQVKGKVRNAVGGAKDAMRDKRMIARRYFVSHGLSLPKTRSARIDGVALQGSGAR
jgi:uncharacterized protein YjbJ (UPF0337 family)